MERASILGRMVADNIKDGGDKSKLSEKYNHKMYTALEWEIIRAILKT